MGKPAYDFGQQVYEDVFCAPVLTPGAIREEFGDTPPTLRALTIREDVIGSIVLYRRIVSINFKPIGVLAGYFQDAPIRIRFRKNCQLPSKTLRLQVAADGFAADTRFFDPKWKAEFADMGSVGFSPTIRLRAKGGRDQPVRDASSPKR